MANVQVWDDKVHLFLGEAIYAHFYVFADPAKVDSDLQHAFSFQTTIRVGGIQFWDTGAIPLTDTQISAKPDQSLQSFNLPTLDGAISGFEGLDSQGRPAGANWSNAVVVSFVVTSKADVTLPVSELATALAALGPAGVAARAVLMASSVFARKVRLSIGHSNVTIQLQRDASGKIVQINHVAVKAPAHA